MNSVAWASSFSLLPQHMALLTASGIAPEVAQLRGYRSVTTLAELRRLGFSEAQRRVPALLLPIWNTAGERVNYQLRPDEPRFRDGRPVKYETVAGSRMVLDVPPPARKWLSDPTRPLFITEGVRKADSAVSKGLCCVDLLGVWSFRGTNTVGGKVALGDWESVALNARDIYIVFDSDVMTKPGVHAALVRLNAFLETRTARVKLIYLPPGPGGEKVGLDAYLSAGHGIEDLFALATPILRGLPRSGDEHTHDPGPYCVQDGRLCFISLTRDGPMPVPLCNFTAEVVEEVELDDGCETSRAFVVEGKLDTGQTLPPARISSDRFTAMSWIPSTWGLPAIVGAGFSTKDRLREAIQRFSARAHRRKVFTHTGWRKIEGRWLYLTASGAVGTNGFEVDLGPELTRYCLPRTIEDPVAAMRCSLRLLDVAKLTVTAPLWAGVFRAPLAVAYPLDLSLWI